MNQDQKKYFKERLLEEKERLTKEMNILEENERISLLESTDELSSYDNHPADNGTTTFEREKDLGLQFNTAGLLEQVENALKIVDSEKYGICEKCGKEIGNQRLEALPYTSLCKECSAVEDDFVDENRQVEEELLWPPFGRSFTDDTDSVIYDGEDTWQDVAQYGTSNTIQDVPDIANENRKEAYIEADEKTGVVGIEDAIYNNEVETLEEAEEEETTFTGEMSETER